MGSEHFVKLLLVNSLSTNNIILFCFVLFFYICPTLSQLFKKFVNVYVALSDTVALCEWPLSDAKMVLECRSFTLPQQFIPKYKEPGNHNSGEDMLRTCKSSFNKVTFISKF